MSDYDDDCRYADVLAYRTFLDGSRIDFELYGAARRESDEIDGVDGEDFAYLGFARDYVGGFGPLSDYLRVRLVLGIRYLPFRLSRFAASEVR
jgi:hypothetical protein